MNEDTVLYTKDEVAGTFSVSKRTIDNWMRQGKIPFIRVSKRLVRFHLPSVSEALREKFTVNDSSHG